MRRLSFLKRRRVLTGIIIFANVWCNPYWLPCSNALSSTATNRKGLEIQAMGSFDQPDNNCPVGGGKGLQGHRQQPEGTVLKTANNNSRRNWFQANLIALITIVGTNIMTKGVAHGYTPDPDALRESLYLVCRVQEATCLQERYIQKARPPIRKMKLTLRLVDKSYRLQDQINYISKFIPVGAIVDATQVGNEAAEALQDAIDFVYSYQPPDEKGVVAPMTNEQRDYLTAALTDTREKLFSFVGYLSPPEQTKLIEARKRVEEENKLNRDEIDPDLVNDQGVFNPVELPWINRSTGGKGL